MGIEVDSEVGMETADCGSCTAVLASPAFEYRSYGIGAMVVGLVAGVAAIAVEPPLRALFLLVVFGGPFAILLHLFVVRPMVRRVAVEATPLSGCEPEADDATRRRVGRMLALQVTGLAVIAVLGTLQNVPGLPFASGALLGFGASMFAASRWLGRWEDEHSVSLFRAPRYSWRHDPQSGRLGGGLLDPRDFFLVRRS